MHDQPVSSAGEARVHLGRGARWEFFSPRNKFSVGGTGILRLDHLVLLECDPAVSTYKPFPKLTCSIDKVERDTIADSLVNYRDGRRILNSICDYQRADESELEIYRIEKTWATLNGCTHSVLRASDIRGGDQHLYNCRTLLPWLGELHEPSTNERQAVIGAAVLQPIAVTLARLSQLAGCAPEVTVAVAARAYVEGLIVIEDIRTKPLGYDSLIAAVKPH